MNRTKFFPKSVYFLLHLLEKDVHNKPMFGMDITAKDVSDWAEAYQASFQLPRLVRNLILETATGIRHFDSPSEERVSSPEYDGLLDCEDGIFIPRGRSVWELTTDPGLRRLFPGVLAEPHPTVDHRADRRGLSSHRGVGPAGARQRSAHPGRLGHRRPGPGDNGP